VDICVGWLGFVPVLTKTLDLVIEAVGVLRERFPFKIVGLDSDNDSPFLSESFINYCRREELEFTRSRAYRKNNQAWVERENGALIRRFVGYERSEGLVALRVLSNLYRVLYRSISSRALLSLGLRRDQGQNGKSFTMFP